MTKLSIIIVLIAMSFFNVIYIFASNEEIKKIKIGVYNDSPLVFRTNNKIEGIFPKVFDYISKEINVEYEYVYGTFDEINQELQAGKIDMIFSVADLSKNQLFFDFNKESIIMTWGTIYSKEFSNINSLKNLDGKIIAVVDGDPYYEGYNDSIRETLASFGIKVKYNEKHSYQEVIKSIEKNESDAGVVSRIFSDYYLKDTRLRATPIIFKPINIHFAFKRGSSISAILIPKIDTIMATQKENPKSRYNMILKSFFNNITIVKSLPEWVWQLLFGTIIGLVIAFMVFYIISVRYKMKKLLLEFEEANKRLKELSFCDPLTGISNRRIFDERLEYEIARSKRYGSQLSLIIFDIDHFKMINDTYGHVMGDRVIMKITTFIKTNTRTVDLVSRYGGEEFTVLLPETSLEDAFNIGEKIRKVIENELMDMIFPRLRISITGGVVQWDKKFNSSEEFINSANKALTQGKEEGRNKIVKYTVQ